MTLGRRGKGDDSWDGCPDCHAVSGASYSPRSLRVPIRHALRLRRSQPGWPATSPCSPKVAVCRRNASAGADRLTASAEDLIRPNCLPSVLCPTRGFLIPSIARVGRASEPTSFFLVFLYFGIHRIFVFACKADRVIILTVGIRRSSSLPFPWFAASPASLASHRFGRPHRPPSFARESIS